MNAHGTARCPPAAWDRFGKDREGKHPCEHPANDKGWRHADGCTGFDEPFAREDVHEMACMAQVRRKFVDIFQAQGSQIAEEAIRRSALLHAVEKAARGRSPDERAAQRQRHAKAVCDDPQARLAAQLTRIPGKSELAKAIRHAPGRMKKMRGYPENGFPEPDNKCAGRSIRCVAPGRKNHLLVGSQGGGKAAAFARTPIKTAKRNDGDPQARLTRVRAQIADHKITRIDEPMPWRYAATAA